MAEKTWADLAREVTTDAKRNRARVDRRKDDRASRILANLEESVRPAGPSAPPLGRMTPAQLVELADDVLTRLGLPHYSPFAETGKATEHVARTALTHLAKTVEHTLGVTERKSRVRAYLVLVTAAKEWPALRAHMTGKIPARFIWRWVAKATQSIWEAYGAYCLDRHGRSARRHLSRLAKAVKDPDHPMRST